MTTRSSTPIAWIWTLVTVGALTALAATAGADLPQRTGWPVSMAPGVSGGYVLSPFDGLALADLVKSSSGTEVIGSSGDRVWVWDAAGKDLTGWPQSVKGTAQTPPAVGDIDGDGDLEVVQVGRGLRYSDTSNIHAWHHDGTAVKGWPVAVPNLIYNAPTLADLDGNGALDVLVQLGKYNSSSKTYAGTLFALSGDGSPLGHSWSHALPGQPLAPVAVGDIDGDGDLEVVFLTQGALHVLDAQGGAKAPFPLTAASGRYFRGGVLLADVDPARKGLEIVTADITNSSSARSAHLLCFGADGKALQGFPAVISADAFGLSAPSVGDIDGDGKLELVIAVKGDGLAVVGSDGKLQGGKLIKTSKTAAASVMLIDLDGDGKLELTADNNSMDPATYKGYLEAYEADGTPVQDFPLRPPGWTMSDSPSLADLDGDGKLELAIPTTRNMPAPAPDGGAATDGGSGVVVESFANVWTVAQAKVAATQWATYAHDVRRSNCAATTGCAQSSKTKWKADGGPPDAAVPEAGPMADSGAGDAAGDVGADAGDAGGDDSGCGCRLSGRDPARGPLPALGLVALLMLALLRRGRCIKR
jgi:MYXO-CTERM domain-containing protein